MISLGKVILVGFTSRRTPHHSNQYVYLNFKLQTNFNFVLNVASHFFVYFGMLLSYNMINLICLSNLLLLQHLQIADVTTSVVLVYNIDENLNMHYEREVCVWYRTVAILSFFHLFHM